MRNVDILIAREFVAACPVGWGIGPDSELTRLEDGTDGEPRWHLYNPSQETDEVSGVEDATRFLLVDCGFGDWEGIRDLVDRLRTGQLGGGS